MSNYDISRRRFLGRSVVAAASLGFASALPANASEWAEYSSDFSFAHLNDLPEGTLLPDDEHSWRRIAANYSVTRKITNLENGYWGIMATPVLQEYKRLTDIVNRENTLFARIEAGGMYQGVRDVIAKFLGVAADEIALTRGATEGLQALIGGYTKLSPGDTVLYADIDYAEMKTAMRWLEIRRGVKAEKLSFPEPTPTEPLTEADILAFYERSFDAHPKTKLLLLTHLNNLTGLIIPVAKIAKIAKQRGIDVILDAAHSVGQVDFAVKDLGCDFVGMNLHKWIGAPIGCGLIYIRKERIADIDTYMGKSGGSTDITARIDTGTSNFAAHMTIPAAIAFHSKIGSDAKEARLRYLRGLWVAPARKLRGITVLTPDEKTMVAGLTSFRLDGTTSTKGNDDLVKLLREKFGILTVRRSGLEMGDCIRVTPAIYNSPQDPLKLASALEKIARGHVSS